MKETEVAQAAQVVKAAQATEVESVAQATQATEVESVAQATQANEVAVIEKTNNTMNDLKRRHLRVLRIKQVYEIFVGIK